jgi:hypothetical protein
LLKWLVKTDIDISILQEELDKPFPDAPETPPITSKICSKCHEDLPVEKFGKNRSKSDGYDIRCKDCYKEERQKNPDNTNRALEYYHEHKEKCITTKTEWNKKNKDKVNAANRKSYAKKIANKIEQELEEANKAAENMTKNMTLLDKDDKPYSIVCRESDGYIDVTNLCKAGGRLYKNWYRLEKTKEFLKTLEEDIQSEYQQKGSAHFCTDLINTEMTGLNENRGTWVHPKVAINIAQWISPKFDVQVTKWVHQLLVVGSVRLSDEHKDEEIMGIQKGKIKYNILKTEGKDEEAAVVKEEVNNRLLELEKKNKELENK